MSAASAPHPLTLIAACEAEMRGNPNGFASLGIAKPRTLLDVWRVMGEAQDRLTPTERAALARRDRYALELARQASRGPFGSAHEPRAFEKEDADA